MTEISIDSIAIMGVTPATVEHVVMGPEKVISGELGITDSLHFTSADSGFITGIWESGPGKFHAQYVEDEFYYMLYGKVVITDSAGRARTFSSGDCITVPAGFVGTWEVLEPTKKFYAHHRPRPVGEPAQEA
ncbi:cupin domain-containing protein [Kitasatospora sp. NBC_01287]|uniref:cupin domain-containing protein n=1 Tax=Kitasatospora sp. NBC_01287 TaxID=2903573 RepID=UPI0022593F9A|nr:cupin domain-containing protein [Kitasatospora sp. NBC_01287]MCX4746941.1 cupin domain-containing protein [Kitasatospora sp. NBC_01287]